MTYAPNPFREPLVWDVLLLGGIPAPGLWEIDGAGSPRKWETKSGTGTSGATTKYQGDDVPKFTARGTFYNDFEIDYWDEVFAPLIEKPPPGTKPKALSVFHGALSRLNITEAVVEDVSQLKQVADGIWQLEIKFIEFRAGKAAGGKPKKAIDDLANDKGTNSQDEYDVYIQQLTGEVKDLL